MIDDETIPQSEPSGALVPLPSHPSTALVTSPSSPRAWENDALTARDLFARVVERTFDALDTVGDSIANAIGLR